MPLQTGDVAPDFELPAVRGEEKLKFKLSDHRGQNVVIAFYPMDWTPVCSTQIPTLQSNLEKFAAQNTQIVAISTDSIPSHIAWQQKSIGAIGFPIASDFFPHGEVARKYGVFREEAPVIGVNNRAIFVVDKQGKLAFAKVYEIKHQPDPDEVFAVLKGLA